MAESPPSANSFGCQVKDLNPNNVEPHDTGEMHGKQGIIAQYGQRLATVDPNYDTAVFVNADGAQAIIGLPEQKVNMVIVVMNDDGLTGLFFEDWVGGINVFLRSIV